MVAKMKMPFSDGLDRSRYDPERALLVEIVRLAMHDYIFYKGDATILKDKEKQSVIRRAFQSADAFIFSELDFITPFAFGWICTHLSDEPEALAHSIRKFLINGTRKLKTDLIMGRNRRIPYRSAAFKNGVRRHLRHPIH